ncbi:MAG: hypothetical protein VW362_12455 [Candidatus Nanopelagicales bacterium]|jgi:hypothetical protein
MNTRTQDGRQRIDAERARQVAVEGWTPEHDDQHLPGVMARAARCYDWHAQTTIETGRVCQSPPPTWPWEKEWWKPSADPVRDWEKAGALYLAEMERANRSGADGDAFEYSIAAKLIAEAIDDHLSKATA